MAGYNNFRIFLVAVLMVMVTGCANYDISDLESYTRDVLARPGGRIEDLPEVKPYEPYAYQSAQQGRVDPFHLFYQQRAPVTEEVVDTGLTPEMENEIRNRNREELEEYELDSLRMVGTMQDQADNWGIIVDPDGIVHRINVGNYMGRNIGKVTNIYEDRIELREIIRTVSGRWEEREAAIALTE
jgi:type IV pilus assembly protein PilP